jgi:hypothetical protein
VTAASSVSTDDWQWILLPGMGFFQHSAYYVTLCGSGDDINKDDECVSWDNDENDIKPDWGGTKVCAILTVVFGVLAGLMLAFLWILRVEDCGHKVHALNRCITRRTTVRLVYATAILLLVLASMISSILLLVLLPRSVSGCGKPFCNWTIAACQENCNCVDYYENEPYEDVKETVEECQNHCWETCSANDYKCQWALPYGGLSRRALAVAATMFYGLTILGLLLQYRSSERAIHHGNENRDHNNSIVTTTRQSRQDV